MPACCLLPCAPFCQAGLIVGAIPARQWQMSFGMKVCRWCWPFMPLGGRLLMILGTQLAPFIAWFKSWTIFLPSASICIACLCMGCPSRHMKQSHIIIENWSSAACIPHSVWSKFYHQCTLTVPSLHVSMCVWKLICDSSLHDTDVSCPSSRGVRHWWLMISIDCMHFLGTS